MNLQEKIRYRYRMSNIVEKMIAVNVVVFVLFFLLKTIAFLFKLPADSLMIWFTFPKDPVTFLYRPWSVITYAFLHAGLFHILGNMFILYFSGRMFLTYYSPKRFVNYYFLGAIAGAAVFMLSYNLFPAFQGSGQSYLLGASAAVMAILVGVSTQAPNTEVRLMFLGNLKLWWIAVFFVVLDVVQIPFGNAGGHLAHLGGALLGFIYTVRLHQGTDIGKWFENLIEWFAKLFATRKQKPFKTVYRNKSKTKARRGPHETQSFTKDEKQKRIDAILDKISKNGYESLTKTEKDFLFNAGKD